MDDEPSDSRRFVLIALGALWLMSFVYGFVAFATTPQDDGTEASSRVASFLGWQGIAGLVAFAIYGVGLAWDKDSAARRLARVPLLLACLMALGIGGTFLWISAF